MVKIFDRLRKRGDDSDEANQIISGFNDERSEKRIEIENTPHVYYAVPTLRSGAVVIFTPERLQKVVSEGQWVRIRIPDADRKDVRLQISSAKHGGTGAMATTPDCFSLLCKIPGASAEPTKRASDRYITSHYRDLLLDISSPVAGSYPVIDLSAQGLKIHVSNPDQIGQFTIGEYYSLGRMRLGSKARVEIKVFIPRVHFGDSVGLEIAVNASGHSQRILSMFLESLESKTRGAKEKPRKKEDAAEGAREAP